MAFTPTIILVRHGSTELNEKKGTIRGWLDIPLDKKGMKEAKEAAQTVAIGWNPRKLYSSDLRRAEDSAKYIEGETHLTVNPKFGLRPWNAGKLTGDGADRIDEWIEHFVENPEESPTDGEPMQTFIDRLLNEISSIMLECESGTSPICVVTSIRPIEVIMGWLDAGMRGDQIDPERLKAKKDSVKPGGIVVLTKSRSNWSYKIHANV